MTPQYELPTDQYGHVIPLARGIALKQTVNASLSASVEITLQTNSTLVRVYAINQDVYLRWGIEDVNASLFDEVIPAGQIVDLVVPMQPQGSALSGTPFTAFNVIER